MKSPAVRRLLHAGSSTLLLFSVFGSPLCLRLVLLGGVLSGVALDILRITRPAIGGFMHRLLPVFRESEAARLSGATWLCMGYAIAAWFPYPASAAGILAAAFADPAASYAGSTLTDSSTRKTWMGSGAAALVALVMLMVLGLPVVVAAFGAVIATALERWPGPFDDNLIVPPGVAFVVWLLP